MSFQKEFKQDLKRYDTLQRFQLTVSALDVVMKAFIVGIAFILLFRGEWRNLVRL